MHLSKEFFELIKAIGESKSKQEEDRIIASEILTLKKKLDGSGSGGGGGLMAMSPGSPIPNIGTPIGGNKGANSGLGSKKKAREFLVRLLYVEMLGHDGSFGFIKAVVSHIFSIAVVFMYYFDDFLNVQTNNNHSPNTLSLGIGRSPIHHAQKDRLPNLQLLSLPRS